MSTVDTLLKTEDKPVMDKFVAFIGTLDNEKKGSILYYIDGLIDGINFAKDPHKVISTQKQMDNSQRRK